MTGPRRLGESSYRSQANERAEAPPTPKQIDYLRSLAAKVCTNALALDDHVAKFAAGTRAQCSVEIDRLIALTKKTATYHKPSGVAPSQVPLGIHRTTDPETYWKVQENRAKTHRYAKRLTITDGRGSFDYVAGGIRLLSDATALTYEQACEFGLKHSFCVVCGATLDDALSVVRGIGPVCEKGWPEAPPRTAQAKRDAVTFLESGVAAYSAPETSVPEPAPQDEPKPTPRARRVVRPNRKANR